MNNAYIVYFLTAFLLIGSLAFPSNSYSGTLGKRLQFEGNFATAFQGDAGYNFNLNYAPRLPGNWDKTIAVGAFWQWTFNGDEFRGTGDNTNLSKLGGELRLQKPFFNDSFVPYVKAEAGWLRFDNSRTEDKFAAGPGAGFNFWLNRSLGFGAEVNTVFVASNDNLEDQITTFMAGPRVRF